MRQAFAGAVKKAFPNYLRLSIHESIGEHKVSFSLLDTKTGYTTPWHCSVAQLANCQWVSAPMGDFQKDPRLEMVYEDGRPSYFKEKLDTTGKPHIDRATADYLHTPKRFNGKLSGYSSPSTVSLASRRTTPVKPFEPTPHRSPESGNAGESIEVLDCNVAKEPEYGHRLIPQIMDSLAVAEPNRVVFSLAKVSDNGLDFQTITALRFSKAVDKTAWWLYNLVEKSEFVRPLGYIGPHDLRHVLITYACVKVGYATLHLSPKNSIEGSLAVLEATRCNVWAKASEVPVSPLVNEILQQRAMKLLELPLLEYLLDAETTAPFPYSKEFKEATNDPFCYLHTSGSTGVPKPIPWSHGLIGTMDAIRLLPRVDGDENLLPWTSDWKEGDRIYSSFPMCHVSISSLW